MRCSTVATFAPPPSSALHSRVSVTASALARMSTGVARSILRNTIPVSRGAGRSDITTFLPVCKPMPVALMTDLMVRCLSMVLLFEQRVGV